MEQGLPPEQEAVVKCFLPLAEMHLEQIRLVILLPGTQGALLGPGSTLDSVVSQNLPPLAGLVNSWSGMQGACDGHLNLPGRERGGGCARGRESAPAPQRGG